MDAPDGSPADPSGAAAAVRTAPPTPMPGRAWYAHTTRTILTGGIEIHTLDIEGDPPASRPPLVLLHGFGANLLAWRHVVLALTATGRRVVAFDRPGWGRSPLPPPASGLAAFSLESDAEVTIRLLDALGIGSAVLVGSSAGGTVALEVAHRAPDRVAGLVLVDAAVLGVSGPPPLARAVAGLPGLRSLAPAVITYLAPRTVGRALGGVWHDAGKITPEVCEAAAASFQADGWAGALWRHSAGFSPPEITAHLGTIAAPTLVITGDHDRVVPTHTSIELAGRIAGSHLVIIPRCGHLPMEEQPDDFVAAVLPFLAMR